MYLYVISPYTVNESADSHSCRNRAAIYPTEYTPSPQISPLIRRSGQALGAADRLCTGDETWLATGSDRVKLQHFARQEPLREIVGLRVNRRQFGHRVMHSFVRRGRGNANVRPHPTSPYKGEDSESATILPLLCKEGVGEVEAVFSRRNRSSITLSRFIRISRFWYRATHNPSDSK